MAARSGSAERCSRHSRRLLHGTPLWRRHGRPVYRMLSFSEMPGRPSVRRGGSDTASRHPAKHSPPCALLFLVRSCGNVGALRPASKADGGLLDLQPAQFQAVRCSTIFGATAWRKNHRGTVTIEGMAHDETCSRSPADRDRALEILDEIGIYPRGKSCSAAGSTLRSATGAFDGFHILRSIRVGAAPCGRLLPSSWPRSAGSRPGQRRVPEVAPIYTQSSSARLSTFERRLRD